MSVIHDPRTGRRGVRGWWPRTGGGPGTWALLANRVCALVLVGYLYLHLGVLSLLVRGDGTWDQFLAIAGKPAFVAVDLVLFAAVLWHATNGVRVALVGSGLAVARHRALMVAAAAATVLVLVVAGALLGTEG